MYLLEAALLFFFLKAAGRRDIISRREYLRVRVTFRKYAHISHSQASRRQHERMSGMSAPPMPYL